MPLRGWRSVLLFLLFETELQFIFVEGKIQWNTLVLIIKSFSVLTTKSLCYKN